MLKGSMSMPRSNTREFRQVPSWPNYEVNQVGVVRTIKTGHIKRQKLHHGYWHISAQRRGSRTRQTILVPVHRLVLEAWVGPCPSGLECRHLNDVKTDNRLENLTWGTRHENSADSIRNGRQVRGARIGDSKLTEAEVREIRGLYAAGGVTYQQLAENYHTCMTNVWYIVHRRTWTHI